MCSRECVWKFSHGLKMCLPHPNHHSLPLSTAPSHTPCFFQSSFAAACSATWSPAPGLRVACAGARCGKRRRLVQVLWIEVVLRIPGGPYERSVSDGTNERSDSDRAGRDSERSDSDVDMAYKPQLPDSHVHQSSWTIVTCYLGIRSYV